MESERNDNPAEPSVPQNAAGTTPPPPPPPPGPAYPPYSPPPPPIYGPGYGPGYGPAYGEGYPPRRKSGWRVLWGIFTFLSVAANILLLVLVIGAFALIATGGTRGAFTEQVVESGPRTDKIAIIPISGIIDGAQAQRVTEQLKNAKSDKAVRGLILRVNSPGGSISGSDQIYNEVRKFRTDSGKPVVAFMESMAASGGYYCSVACEKIIAEPTVITGSIGVIMANFVFGDLLEKKLGVQPVIIKSGEKKDWPSSFRAPTDEELQYLRDRIIMPAYDRFLAVVAEGRKDILTPEQIRPLADGGIYTAGQAKDNKLIDEIGYLDDAISKIKSLAGVSKAEVVEYRPVFSFMSILDSKTNLGIKIDRSTILEITMPQAMYLWRAF
jgi:protease IV